MFTSFHQSALPLALLLRLAGSAAITAISDDYPGSLLDVRHRVPAGCPSPSGRCRWPRPPASRSPPVTTAGCACASPPPE